MSMTWAEVCEPEQIDLFVDLPKAEKPNKRIKLLAGYDRLMQRDDLASQFNFLAELDRSVSLQLSEHYWQVIKNKKLTEENQRSQAIWMEELYKNDIECNEGVLDCYKIKIRRHIEMLKKFTHYAATLRKEVGQGFRDH